MNLLRTLSGITCLALAGLSLSGCLSAPSYSNTPEIEFRDVKIERILDPNGGVGSDTLQFVIGFRDGDGDLGLDPDDLNTPPFNATTGGRNNKGYGLNYFIQPFRKNPATGTFELFVTPPPVGQVGQYDSRYPRLNGPDGRKAPLKGELRFKLPLTIDGNAAFPGVINEGDVFRFEISILDRALNESNKITTSAVTL